MAVCRLLERTSSFHFYPFQQTPDLRRLRPPRESGALDALFSVHHVRQDRVDSAEMAGPFRFQPRKHVILDAKGDRGSFGPHPERDHLSQLLVGERRDVREVDL